MSRRQRFIFWLGGWRWAVWQFVKGPDEQGRLCFVIDCDYVRQDPPLEFTSGGYTYRFRLACRRCGAPECGSEILPVRPEVRERLGLAAEVSMDELLAMYVSQAKQQRGTAG